MSYNCLFDTRLPPDWLIQSNKVNAIYIQRHYKGSFLMAHILSHAKQCFKLFSLSQIGRKWPIEFSVPIFFLIVHRKPIFSDDFIRERGKWSLTIPSDFQILVEMLHKKDPKLCGGFHKPRWDPGVSKRGLMFCWFETPQQIYKYLFLRLVWKVLSYFLS